MKRAMFFLLTIFLFGTILSSCDKEEKVNVCEVKEIRINVHEGEEYDGTLPNGTNLSYADVVDTVDATRKGENERILKDKVKDTKEGLNNGWSEDYELGGNADCNEGVNKKGVKWWKCPEQRKTARGSIGGNVIEVIDCNKE